MLPLNQHLGNIEVEHLYRAEFRFINIGYKNRFRYRIGFAHPFGKKIKNYKPFKISVIDEVVFTNKDPFFARNRLSLALNFKTSKHVTLQTGYVGQFDYKITKQTIKDVFPVGL